MTRFEVSATLRAGEVVVTFELPEEVTSKESGIPGFIVQLDPPAGVELIGERVLEFKELHANQFLMAPWERLVEGEELFVPLGWSSPQGTLGINVVGYLSTAGEEDDTFVRQRLELPLEVGATARVGDARDSSWGAFGSEVHEPEPLKIGDELPSFTLPLLGSDEIWSSDSLDSPTLLVTYRGHW